MTMTISRFAFPTTIHFGPGASALVAEHLKSVGVHRPLIVTDKGLAPLPVAQRFAQSLAAGGLAVETFSGIWGNPMASMVGTGVAAYRAHHADAVVGFGGGAALDVAKLVALMATNAGDDVLEYAWDHPQVRAIANELPYFVALPTTAGTGSEVGRSSVVSDDKSHIKKIVFSPKLLAKVVFADPELTLDLPPQITAATGMDALTHNVESYLSPAYHPLCDGIALEGVRIAARAAAGREGAEEYRGARRHDDGLDDGRDRVPERPGRGAFLRACAVDRRRSASRPGQRHHDRPCDALQRVGGRGENGRNGARRAGARRQGDERPGRGCRIHRAGSSS